MSAYRNGKGYPVNLESFRNDLKFKRVPSLPVFDFIDCAIKEAESFVVESSGCGFDEEWKAARPTFFLARHLKAHPRFRIACEEEAVSIMEEYFQDLGCEDLDQAWAEAFPSSDSGDPRTEFTMTWHQARVPFGTDTVRHALQNASQFPLKLPYKTSKKELLFASAVFHLQKWLDDQSRFAPVKNDPAPIFIGQEKWAMELEVDRHAVGHWIKKLEAFALLRKVVSATRTKAARFRAKYDLFNWVTGEFCGTQPIQKPTMRPMRTLETHEDPRLTLEGLEKGKENDHTKRFVN